MVERKLPKTIFFILNIIVSACIVMPILYTASISLMPPNQIFKYPPPLIPNALHIKNYFDALKSAPIHLFIRNSMVVAVACTIGQLFTGALAGYAFAIIKFKGHKVVFMVMLATMMIPGQAIIIANYLTLSDLRLLDTYTAMIIPYLASAFSIFSLRQAFLQLPSELREAALIDGCSDFPFFWRIALPLAKPTLGALGIYTFLQVWNQYLWPLLVVNTTTKRTVQIGIGMLQNADGSRFGPIMAGIVMVLVPSILAFVLGQKQMIAGLTSGSVKG